MEKYRRRGFTLIEMLVALGIFTILMLTVVGIFLTTSRAQRKNIIEQRVLHDARYVLESIASDMRTGIPDYTSYIGGPVAAETVLRLKDEDGISIVYRKSNNPSECLQDSIPCLVRQTPLGASSITSLHVIIDDLVFAIAPLTDPFPGGSLQPRVTIALALASTELAPERVMVRVQTTASSRIYGP